MMIKKLFLIVITTICCYNYTIAQVSGTPYFWGKNPNCYAPVPQFSTLIFNNICPNNYVDLPTAALNTPAGYELQYHTIPNPTSAASKINSPITATGTYYAVHYRANCNLYSNTTPVNVNISACIVPDLSVYFLFGPGILPANQQGLGIQINNLNSAATTAPIVVKLTSVPNNLNAASITFNASINQITIYGSTFAVQNPNFDVTYNNLTQEYIFTSKPGVVIAGNSSLIIGLSVIKNPSNTGYMDAIFDSTVSGGGETYTNNNSTSILLEYDYNLDYE